MLLVWVGIILSGEKKNFQHTKHIVDIVFFYVIELFAVNYKMFTCSLTPVTQRAISFECTIFL